MAEADTQLLERLPLAFHDCRAVIEPRIDGLAERLRRSLPLAELLAPAQQGPFLHRSTSALVGDLAITAAAHSPLMGRTHAQSRAVFTMALYGNKQFRLAGTTLVCRAGHSSLFLPGEAYQVETGLTSGVMFSVDRAQLQAVARAMVGAPEEATVLEVSRLEAPRIFWEQDRLEGRLLGLLRRSLRLIDRSGAAGHPPSAAGLRLDDVIHRALVLLLQPELHRSSPILTPMGRPSEGFDRLVTLVRQDPCRTWGLSDMERLSGLGREALRAAVRQVFGCAPLLWLAAERQAWARRQERDQPDPSSGF
ncbi:MAG: hypothetical protein VKO00_06440 [Cyanobacteriota bacterium]|nr:hypothetical protein [Cyanobacteriota bacterium]